MEAPMGAVRRLLSGEVVKDVRVRVLLLPPMETRSKVCLTGPNPAMLLQVWGFESLCFRQRLLVRREKGCACKARV